MWPFCPGRQKSHKTSTGFHRYDWRISGYAIGHGLRPWLWSLDILVSQPLGFPTDNPEGVASLSPGLLYSATLGDGVEWRTSLVIDPNPEGVASCRMNCHGAARFVIYRLGEQGHNPVGVGKQRDPPPQGSRVQQPWASRRNPFGVVPPHFSEVLSSATELGRAAISAVNGLFIFSQLE